MCLIRRIMIDKEVKLMDITKNNLKVVTRNDFITAKGMENISLKARKLLYLTTAQIKLGDTEFFEYKIKASDFARLMGISSSHVYEEADRITDELMRLYISVIPEGGKKFKKYHVVKNCEYDDDSYLKIMIDDDMLGFFIGLKKNFSQPELFDFIKMKSNYSIEIWHLMQREMKSKKPGVKRIEFYLSLAELRDVTGTNSKFKQISQFKEKVLDKAIREIRDNCSTEITYSNVKKGRSIVGFDFRATLPGGIDFTDWEHSNPDVVALFKKKARKIELLKKKHDNKISNNELIELDKLINELCDDKL